MKTLKQYRKSSPLSIQEIADHMNVTTRMVYMWETGERKITPYNLYRIMELYGADLKLSDIPALLPQARELEGMGKE